MSSLEDRYAPTVRSLAEKVRVQEGGVEASLVYRAFRYAAAHHEGEKRLNGDRFLAHSVSVAKIVGEFGGDSAVLAAALVHDVRWRKRDNALLAQNFGEHVARLVDESTSLHGETALDSVDRDVLLLKLADRLHNLHTIDVLARETQVEKAAETLNLLVPRAEHIGLGGLGRELRVVADRTLTLDSPSTSSTSPTRLAGTGLLNLAALLLPRQSRARWTSEWRAELAALPSRRARLGFAVDVALGCPGMAIATRRGAVAGEGEA